MKTDYNPSDYSIAFSDTFLVKETDPEAATAASYESCLMSLGKSVLKWMFSQGHCEYKVITILANEPLLNDKIYTLTLQVKRIGRTEGERIANAPILG